MAEINIPTGPIETEPYKAIRRTPGEASRDVHRDALTAALAGLELGAWDDELLRWLAGWEPSVVATVCSWLHRVRALPPPPTAPTVRGGPDIGRDADDEFRREQDDHNPEEQA